MNAKDVQNDKSEDVEDRIAVVLERLFRNMGKVGRKYFDKRHIMVGNWSGENRQGWVKKILGCLGDTV